MKKLFKWLVILTLVAAVVGVGGVAGIFYYYGRDLPEILSRDDFDPPQMSRIYSSEGEVIGEFFTPGAKRTVVPEDEIPKHVRHAFMAAEDADFMAHEGIDYLGLIRAFYNAVRYDNGIKGTSTITQQVVKNLILSPERSVARKVREIILAREIEKNLTKGDILYLYLNTIYLGHGVNGVEEAARHYFGKHVSELTLAEGALLAGITQSPESLTPFRHRKKALKRRSYVLKQLWEKGFIEEAAYREAEKTDIALADRDKTFPHLDVAPHYVEHIRKKLVEKYGEDEVIGGGLRVHTALQIEAQEAAVESLRKGLKDYDDRKELFKPRRKIAEKEIKEFNERIARQISKRGLKAFSVYDAVVTAVDSDAEKVSLRIGDRNAVLELEPRKRIFGPECSDKKIGEVLERGHVIRVQLTEPKADTLKVRFAPGPEGAVVSIDPANRHVVAMVGGYDYETNQYDHATQAARQTGSTFKPFVYGAALEAKTITPASVYLDSPTCFKLDGGKSWCPQNSDGTWRGPIRIREGLGASRNVVAVRVLKDVGIDKAIDFARRTGVTSELVDNFTMVMGSSEMTPLELTNAYATLAAGGLKDEPVFITRVESVKGTKDVFETRPERTIAPEVAYLLSNLMLAVTGGYTNSEGQRRGGTAGKISKLGHEVAGKTGTTNEARDAWFVGYTPKLVTGVWVGFSDNASLGRKEYGGRVAAPIWLSYMKDRHEGIEERLEFAPPQVGITKATVDPKTGKLAREGGIEESFLTGTAPSEYAPASDSAGSQSEFLLGQFGDE